MSRASASRYQPMLVALQTLLAVLIAGHVAAALYHQFALKDGLFRRMWFGERTITPAENRKKWSLPCKKTYLKLLG